MERQQFQSSSILAVGYDPIQEVLEVEFVKTGLYQYMNVPAFIYEQLMTAPSVGIYFNANVKDQFACSRM